MTSHFKSQAKAYGHMPTQKKLGDSLIISKKASLAMAIGLGLFLLYGAGFAMPAALHNAAHDTRHTIAFPCH